ncbi:MAG: (Fe-S)-binding protein [Saprospiraceae bacterium]
MKIGLFIPCYIDQFYPEVGKISYLLLQKLGHEVYVPMDVQCCGQPIANAGYEDLAKPLYNKFVEQYKDFDMVVMPSGSCTYHIKSHYTNVEQSEQLKKIRRVTIDICDFLLKYEKDNLPKVEFSGKVALHTGCHSLRGLRFGEGSEIHKKPHSKLKELLSYAENAIVNDLDRPDECCGFGGTFAIAEEAISVKMGNDKIRDVKRQEVDYLISNDMSCLMHLGGIIKKKKEKIKVMHVIEIFKDFVNG